MEAAEEIRNKFEKELKNDGIDGVLIQHDVYEESPLGILFDQESLPEDYADITAMEDAASAHPYMTRKLFPGMHLCAIGDFDCDGKSVNEINAAIMTAGRPVTVTCALSDLTRRVDPDASEEDSMLQIQSVVDALQTHVRQQQVELKHLRHEMEQRDKALDDSMAHIDQIVKQFRVVVRLNRM